jgi:hypothetical protein
VSHSSTEVKYRSFVIASAELVWMQYILQELQVTISSPPVIWCDNIGASYLASNLMFHARTKYIEIDYHFVREHVISGQLLLQFLSSKDQISDIMTNALTTSRFGHLTNKLTYGYRTINLRGL